jgi:indole-3-glycerol phosphate synthase
MRAARHFSQAISEGDGISLLVECGRADEAGGLEEAGAEGVVVRGLVPGARDATELPILWARHGPPEEALAAGADACLVAVEELEADGELERAYVHALDLGLDVVLKVSEDEQLELALERVDPEIFLLSAEGAENDDVLDHVLGLLQDVPAGKLAIADLAVDRRDELDELERAGMDAVIVGLREIALLAGGSTAER